MTVLSVNKVGKSYGPVVALKEVTFTLKAGEIHALCGENGAGKSTLIKIIAGVLPHGDYTGELEVMGKVAAFRNVRDARASGIGVIYQELNLISELTVAENLFLGDEPTNGFGLIDWDTMFEEARKVLTQYDIQIDPKTPVSLLGVGQQQLVEIVKALRKEPKILLLDEPTAAISQTETDKLLDILRGLKAKGISSIYISHKLNEVFAIADQITVLRDGFSLPTKKPSETSQDEVIRQMVGREISQFYPYRKATIGAPLLKVDGVSVRRRDMPGKNVLTDISLDVKAGEIVGIGGLVGAGRTELLMHLMGAFGDRAKGKVSLLGKDLPQVQTKDVIDRGMVLVTEDRKKNGLILDHEIGFNLSLARLGQDRAFGLIDASAESSRNQGVFDTLRVKAPGLTTVVGQLSGGNQQKVMIGRALLCEPQVILLDEPTRGIDVGAKVEVYEFLLALKEAGKAVLVASSEWPELLGISDRIYVLGEGKIRGEFVRGSANQEVLLRAAMTYDVN